MILSLTFHYMNKKFIALSLAAGMVVSVMAPIAVSANGHSQESHSHVRISHTNVFAQYLISQGYYSEDSSMSERRMGIMKFQKEAGLRQTGSLNIHTLIAIRKASRLPNIVETAVATPILSTLVAAVQAGGLVDTLANSGPFTVFAPTNDAFAKIPADTFASLLTPEKKADLVNILTYHVVSGKAFSTDLTDGQEIVTLQ